MSKLRTSPENAAPQNRALGKRAEKRASKKASRPTEGVAALSADELRKMCRELQNGQIELEKQREELRRAHEKLNAERDRYFDLYDRAPVGYLTVTEQGLIEEANLTSATLLGVARSALSRQLLPGFILEEDHPVYQSHRKQLFETGEPQECNLRMVQQGGKVFWARLTAVAAKDADGAAVCRVTLNDMTDHKRVEQALQESEQLLDRAQRIAHVGGWELDNATHELRWSDETFRIFGYAPGAFQPTMELFLSRIHPEDRLPMQAAVQAAWDSYTLLSADHRIILPDGKEHIVHEQGEITYDDAGRPEKWMGTVQDITERKLAEALFQGVFEYNPTSIQILDKEGRTLRVNVAFTKLFGSAPPADFSIFDDLCKNPALKKLVLHAKNGNVTRFHDMKYNAHDAVPELPDKPVWIRATVFPLSGVVSHVARFVVMHENITEHKRLEDEILQIGDWERVRIGRDLHDTIGQQLVGMAYLVDALEHKLAESESRHAADAKQITLSCKKTHSQLRSVVQGLLPLHLSNGLSEGLEKLADHVQAQMGVECESRCALDVSGLDRSSIGHLYHIAQEAVTNAVRHGQAKRVRITLEQVGEQGELRIDDDGKGICPIPAKDSGSGLKIMRYRADMVRGVLSVTRNEGKGTSVRCTFDRVPMIDLNQEGKNGE